VTDRKALEAILHPPIIDVINRSITWARQEGKQLLVVAPLFIEAGMQGLVDALWVVACSREDQITRFIRRTGRPRDDAVKWIDAQLPLAEKKKLADTVIDNDGTIDELKEAVAREWRALDLD